MQKMQKILEMLQSSENPEQEAANLVVQLSVEPLKIDWRGKCVKSNTERSLHGTQRGSVFLSSFHRPTMGGGVVPVCHYKGRIYTAVVYNRYHDRRPEEEKQKGVPHAWEMPAGFFDPQPPLGGQDGIYRMPKELVDKAENIIYQNNTRAKTEKSTDSDNLQAYVEVGKEYNPQQKPLDLTTYRGHKSSKHCACQELFEETGLKAEEKDLILIGKIEFYNEARGMHQFGLYYMYDEGEVTELRKLAPHTDEIGAAKWIPIDEVKIEKQDKQCHAYHENIPFVKAPYLQFYEKAITKACKAELKNTSDIFNSEKSILSGLKTDLKTLEDVKSIKPKQHHVFGPDAHEYHQKLLRAAEDLDATYSKMTLQA